MIPMLTYPLALAALAALPLLAGIYFLRNRYRRQPVSSLMLWRLPARIREGGTRVDRLQLPFIFFLEMLILGLLVAAATGPRWQLESTLRPLILVLDDSASMLAGQPDRCPRAMAAQALKQLFEHHRARSLRVVFAATQPRQASLASASQAFLNDVLEQWHCEANTSALDAAVLFATELGRGEADILVITDQAPADPAIQGGRLRWWAFGQPLGNAGFVNARRTVQGDSDRCLLEVANYSESAQAVTVTLKADRSGLPSSTFEVASGAVHRLTFSLPDDVGVIEARLADDALGVDNRIILAPPERRRVRTQVRLSHEPSLQLFRETLDASSLATLVETQPELIIHDGESAALGSSAWDLRIRTDAPLTPYHGPFLLDYAHPLTEGVHLDGVIWAAPSSDALVGTPIIAAGNTALLTTFEDALGRQHLTLALDATASTLTSTPAWPSLIWNLLQWRLADTPGLREPNVRLGAEVAFVTRDRSLKVVGPGSQIQETPVRSNPALLRPTHVGLQAIVTSQATNLLAVNFLAAEESDLTQRSSGKWGRWEDERSVRYEYTHASTLFLLAALVGLAGHQAILARTRRIS